MSTIIFLMKSSGDAHYAAIASDEGGRFTLTCNCQAGAFMTFCKHRNALIQGDFSACHVQPSEDEKTQLAAMLALAHWPQKMCEEINALEAEAQKIKKRASALKKQLGRMLEGKK